MELEELFKDRSNDDITAFAFNLGRTIDTAIRVRTNDVQTENKHLQGLILTFRVKLSKELIFEPLLAEFDRHFNITISRTGKIASL